MGAAKTVRGSKARSVGANGSGRHRDQRSNERGDERGDDSRSANPLFIASICKAFEVLERLADIGRPVGLTELCQHASLSRSALQRITHTLTALGYLRQDPKTRAFTLSGKVLHLSHAMLSSDSLRDRALPHLEDLNRRTAETVNLMEMEGDEIVYVVRFRASVPSASICTSARVCRSTAPPRAARSLPKWILTTRCGCLPACHAAR